MTSMNARVDKYLNGLDNWQKEAMHLREIMLDCGLDEEFKWSLPVYAYQGGNIVAVNPLKNCIAIGFFKGALLQDSHSIFDKPGDNLQAVRIIRFTSLRAITKIEATLKAYIYEAIEIQRAGLKVPMKKTSDYPVPPEFQKRLDKSAKLRKAFEALTPGRQRGFLIHFADAKQSKTREARIDKCLPLIMAGKGLHEDWRR
jgi:uncharacterized protein YdeI (YjbR/CyaY-like superfamily)